jgi:hypothetical protein
METEISPAESPPGQDLEVIHHPDGHRLRQPRNLAEERRRWSSGPPRRRPRLNVRRGLGRRD